MFISIAPVAKPRMTQSDRWAKRPAVVRYRAFCDELRRKFPFDLPDILVIEFHIAMPVTWSSKKRAEYVGKPHKQRPDIDNLCKAVMDGLAADDSYIYVLHATKYWGEKAGIDIMLPSEPVTLRRHVL